MLDRPRNPRFESSRLSRRRPAPKGDSRLTDTLDSMDVSYETDEGGNIALGIALENNRSQICYIRSDVQTIGGLKLRAISSPAIRSMGPLDARTMNLLMQQNSETLNLGGGWMVMVDEETDDHLAVFNAVVAADAGGEQLLEAVCAVAQAADEAELHFTGRDDF